jgi:hypothetical protein
MQRTKPPDQLLGGIGQQYGEKQGAYGIAKDTPSLPFGEEVEISPQHKGKKGNPIPSIGNQEPKGIPSNRSCLVDSH